NSLHPGAAAVPIAVCDLAVAARSRSISASDSLGDQCRSSTAPSTTVCSYSRTAPFKFTYRVNVCGPATTGSPSCHPLNVRVRGTSSRSRRRTHRGLRLGCGGEVALHLRERLPGGPMQIVHGTLDDGVLIFPDRAVQVHVQSERVRAGDDRLAQLPPSERAGQGDILP